MLNETLIRIGELSRRAGVSPEVLRAWERRYGLFAPQRTEGGFRLYSAADAARIEAMKRLISEGVSASEAAHRIAASQSEDPRSAAPDHSLIQGRQDALQRAEFLADTLERGILPDREFDANSSDCRFCPFASASLSTSNAANPQARGIRERIRMSSSNRWCRSHCWK